MADHDRILLGRKAAGRAPYPDVWHTLGGGVNDFEKAKALLEKGLYDDPYLHSELKRELLEEAGITVKNIRCVIPKFRSKPREAVAKNKNGVETHYVFLEYLCALAGGLATPSSDIAELRWALKKDLKSIALTPPSQDMYRELGWL